MDYTYDSLKPEADLALAELTALFEIKLSDNPEYLASQIEHIEAHHDRISTLLTYAEEVLVKARDFNLPERERKFNEFDKKIILGAKTAKEETMKKMLERKLDSIETRIQTGQSLLSYHREVAKLGGRQG